MNGSLFSFTKGVARIYGRHQRDRKFFSMRYQDPVTAEWVSRSAKTNKRREAERAAAGVVHPHEVREERVLRQDAGESNCVPNVEREYLQL